MINPHLCSRIFYYLCVHINCLCFQKVESGKKIINVDLICGVVCCEEIIQSVMEIMIKILRGKIKQKILCRLAYQVNDVCLSALIWLP